MKQLWTPLTICIVLLLNRGHVSQDRAVAAGGDTLGSDEPAVDLGGDIAESDRDVSEVKAAAKKANLDVPAVRLKRQDMGDSHDSRFVNVINHCFTGFYLSTLSIWSNTLHILMFIFFL